MKYFLREITPKENMCLQYACPAIYEKTPQENSCALTYCPGIHKTEGETYLIIGKVVNPKDLGLEGKVGDDEMLIEIPKNIIDNMEK